MLSSTASDISTEGKRTQVKPEDIIMAVKEMGFNNYEDELRDYLKQV